MWQCQKCSVKFAISPWQTSKRTTLANHWILLCKFLLCVKWVSIEKVSSAKKLILVSMATLTKRISECCEVLQELQIHPERYTNWCDLWAGGINGSYFLKNYENRKVTVNRTRYRGMITDFFCCPKCKNWTGLTSGFSKTVPYGTRYHKPMKQSIGRQDAVWPHYVFFFFLWGYVKWQASHNFSPRR